MRKYVNVFIALLSLTMLLSCNNANNVKQLTKEDSVTIFNKINSRLGKSGADTIPKSLFGDRVRMMAPRKWEDMRDLHLNYLDNPLPLYSSTETNKKVRYFEVPLKDIEILQKAMKTEFGGLRIYLGYDKSSTPEVYRLILVGVNKTTKANHLFDYEIFDDFLPCPKVCLEGEGVAAVAKTDLNYDVNHAGGPIFKQPK